MRGWGLVFGGVDELGGGDDVEDAAAVDGFSGVAGVVEGGLDDGDAGVFVGDVFGGLGGDGDILEAEGAGVVVGFFGIRDFCEGVGHEGGEALFVDGVGWAVEDPVFVVEVGVAIVDVSRLFHGELEEAWASALIDDEGEVAVGEKFVGDLLDFAFLEVAAGIAVGHVEGDDVAGLDF